MKNWLEKSEWKIEKDRRGIWTETEKTKQDKLSDPLKQNKNNCEPISRIDVIQGTLKP